MPSTRGLYSLPVELQIMTLSWLPPRQVYLCRRIDRHFCALVDDSEHQRPLYAACIARKQQALTDTIERFCFFPTSTLEPGGAQAAFFRAGLDYIRYYGLTLADAIKHSEILYGFVHYYCSRFRAEQEQQRQQRLRLRLQHEHEQDQGPAPTPPPFNYKSVVTWLTLLFAWYQVCHFTPPLPSCISSSTSTSTTTTLPIAHEGEDVCKKCLSAKAAVYGMQARLLVGEEKSHGQLLRWLECTPGLVVEEVDGEKREALRRRRRKVLAHIRSRASASADAAAGGGGGGVESSSAPYLLDREDGEVFLGKVGLGLLPEGAPLQYLVTTKGRGGRWVLDKVRRVAREGREEREEEEGKEEGRREKATMGVFDLALILETVHLG